jgi:hypothetical protein
MRLLWEVADFLRDAGRQMRFGERSRAPLHLLRVEWQEASAKCDWLMRPQDVWDAALSRAERDRNASQQALADAIAMRELVLDSFPAVDCATLQAFRREAGQPAELFITGAVSRDDPYVERVSSLAMRAKLYGFHFDLEDGVLRPLRLREFLGPEARKEVYFDQMTL